MKYASILFCLATLSGLVLSPQTARTQDNDSIIEKIDSQTLLVAIIKNDQQLSRWANLLNLPGGIDAQDLGDGRVTVVISPVEIRLILDDPSGERGKNYQTRNANPANWTQSSNGNVTMLTWVLSGGQVAATPLTDAEKKRWETALTQRGSDPMFAAIAPADQYRRVINELALASPLNEKGVSLARISETLEWVSWNFDNSEPARLKMTFQSTRENEVEALLAELEKVSALVCMLPADPDIGTELAKIMFANEPKTDGTRIVYETFGDGNPELQQFMEKLPVQQEAYTSINSVKQIVLAMHNYESAFTRFPGPAIGKGEAKGLSWRIWMLPYLEHQALFEQFRLDEPWDSEHNKTLIPKMPRVFQHFGSKNKASEGLSNFIVPTGSGLIFEAGMETKFRDIKDGSSNTILVMTVDDEHAEIWTKPVENNFNPKNPRAGLLLSPMKEFLFGRADGSVKLEKSSIADDTLRALMTRDGGETILEDQ